MKLNVFKLLILILLLYYYYYYITIKELKLLSLKKWTQKNKIHRVKKGLVGL